MLSAELFDTLSEIGKRVRNNFSQPFGGIQLVVCGDFFQLPPVQLGPKNNFCFKSQAWQELFPDVSNLNLQQDSTTTGKIIALDRVYRQRENQFLDILHEIRLGAVSESTKQFLSSKVISDLQRKMQLEQREASIISRDRLPDVPNSSSDQDFLSGDHSFVRPTKLFGYNRQVEEYNKSELAKLQTEAYFFSSTDFGINKTYENQLKNWCRLPEQLELKTGAEVTLTRCSYCMSLTLLR
jgi:ATP-dependent DNA helicase PIF1